MKVNVVASKNLYWKGIPIPHCNHFQLIEIFHFFLQTVWYSQDRLNMAASPTTVVREASRVEDSGGTAGIGSSRDARTVII
jgi:hypothetical protein